MLPLDSATTTPDELRHGIPMFLDQLIKTLEIEQTHHPLRSRKVSGPAGGGKPVLSEIGETAARHGKALLKALADRLADQRVIGPYEGSKSREVLMNLLEVDELVKDLDDAN